MGARDAAGSRFTQRIIRKLMTTWFRLSAFPSIKDVRLPIMICQDGFITSHAVENIELLEDEEVKKFLLVNMNRKNSY